MSPRKRQQGNPEKEATRVIAYENSELRLDLIGQTIKKVRLEKNMTQQELGELVGVKKAQISKIENNAKDARFETILKVFKALDAKINFNVEVRKTLMLAFLLEQIRP
mgnify:FL=1|jgi:transcriptional regulator with XRE-family HTH domain